MNTTIHNTTGVTRLKLASVAVAVLATATCLPSPSAFAAVEHRAVQAYEAVKVVYTVATADKPPAETINRR